MEHIDKEKDLILSIFEKIVFEYVDISKIIHGKQSNDTETDYLPLSSINQDIISNWWDHDKQF